MDFAWETAVAGEVGKIGSRFISNGKTDLIPTPVDLVPLILNYNKLSVENVDLNDVKSEENEERSAKMDSVYYYAVFRCPLEEWRLDST